MKTLRELALLLAGSGLAVFGLASALRAPAPATAEPPAATPVTVREIVEVPLDTTGDVSLAGVPESVARVLASTGYAGIVPESALVETLPESVVRVLVDHGATLTVAEGG